MRRIVILGSTGSIGCQAIELVERYPSEFKVVGLSAHSNVELLCHQVTRLQVKDVVVTEPRAAKELSRRTRGQFNVIAGVSGLPELVTSAGADLVLNALVGSVGLEATIASLSAGTTVALANKESLVAGGDLVSKVISEQGAAVLDRIIPVDSEHSAVFQLLIGEDMKDVRRIIITGSGGPFRGRTSPQLADVTVEAALAHPRWSMGRKISVDSATLMNKGLEVIEAHFLFGVGYDAIGVVIHPQSIVHAMVELYDGSIKAHLSPTDMRYPIQYALFYPDRRGADPLDLGALEEITFEQPDTETFPGLKLAFDAGRKGQTYPAVLNEANEVAVAAFLAHRIAFTDIAAIVADVLDGHEGLPADSLAAINAAQAWARTEAEALVDGNPR